jgi:CBS domain-containing protein
MKARDIMNKNVITVQEDSSIEEAAEILTKHFRRPGGEQGR